MINFKELFSTYVDISYDPASKSKYKKFYGSNQKKKNENFGFYVEH